MTKEEILAMQPGREMDATLCKELGYEVDYRKGANESLAIYVNDGVWYEIPHYSTDISAAWEVVEKMHNRGFAMQLMHVVDGRYFAAFSGEIYRETLADTAPEAICKAALLSVMEGMEESHDRQTKVTPVG